MSNFLIRNLMISNFEKERERERAWRDLPLRGQRTSPLPYLSTHTELCSAKTTSQIMGMFSKCTTQSIMFGSCDLNMHVLVSQKPCLCS